MPDEDISERILDAVFDRDYRPGTVRDLAQQLDIPAGERAEFTETVHSLHREGRVIIGEDAVVIPPRMSDTVIGVYQGHPRGFGFITPEISTDHGDLFVPPGRQLSAVTGDTVLARVKRQGKRGGRMVLSGQVIRILQRGRSQFVGQLQGGGQRWFVVPDGRTFHTPIVIPDAATRHIPAGTQVVVEITSYGEGPAEAQGVIAKVLGPPGDPDVDILSIIHQYQLPHEFPETCLEEARQAAHREPAGGTGGRRVDLTDRTIVTIDPDDARDFDDAISLERLADGWELGVHIADVSEFVRLGSDLDREARERGNSVYFPGQVIPMLPEVLSNGVCSLQEGVRRLVKSVFIRYDDSGRVLAERVADGIIRSARRLTYGEASLILDGKTGEFDAAVVAHLQNMGVLARAIQARRRDSGMLTLDLPRVELVLDPQRRVVDVRPEDTSFSHTLIEMFMIEANEAVSRLLTKRRMTHLRRVHAPPQPDATENLAAFLRAIGLTPSEAPDRAELQAVLTAVQGTPQAFSVNLAVLRSLQQAQYSPKREGHYALASEDYCHFTSPIRRYPDLTVHRLVNALLDDSTPPDADPATLEPLGTHCSFTERRSESAERELHTVKILQLLAAHVGETFQGIVVGVAEFGLFVQLDHYLIDGLIRLDDLPDDWEVDTRRGCVRGRRSGRRFVIGARLPVIIARVDIGSRQLDLHLEETRRGSGRRTPAAGRQTSEAKAKPKPKPKPPSTSPRRKRGGRGRGRR